MGNILDVHGPSSFGDGVYVRVRADVAKAINEASSIPPGARSAMVATCSSVGVTESSSEEGWTLVSLGRERDYWSYKDEWLERVDAEELDAEAREAIANSSKKTKDVRQMYEMMSSMSSSSSSSSSSPNASVAPSVRSSSLDTLASGACAAIEHVSARVDTLAARVDRVVDVLERQQASFAELVDKNLALGERVAALESSRSVHARDVCCSASAHAQAPAHDDASIATRTMAKKRARRA